MKLETTIIPRKDGCVTLITPDKAVYKFTPNEYGDLVADITDESHISFALVTGSFHPHSEEDFEAAAALTSSDEEDFEEDDDLDEPSDNQDAAPVEMPTAKNDKKPGRGFR